MVQWARRWGRKDNQEVGLEAAILERVRNSSLVEGSRADNVPGLKSAAEAQDARESVRGRGASPLHRSISASRCGGVASANVGMSNDSWGENPHRRISKVSAARLFRSG